MTRKDYIAIAEVFFLSKEAEDDLDNCARRMADTLATDNARFDRQRFLVACGVPS